MFLDYFNIFFKKIFYKITSITPPNTLKKKKKTNEIALLLECWILPYLIEK